MSSNRKSRAKRSKTGLQAIIQTARQSSSEIGSALKSRYASKSSLTNIRNIAGDIKNIASLLNVERKHIETSNAGRNAVSTNGTGAVDAILPPAEGSDSTNRTGRSIKVVRYDGNMNFYFTSGTVSTTAVWNQTFNWYLVRNNSTTSSSGTTPFVVADMFDLDANSNYTPQSMIDPDNIQQFQVLQCGQVEVRLPANTTAPTTVHKVVSFSHECEFHQAFNNTTAASIVSNAVFIVFTGMQLVNTGGQSQVSYVVRQWFVDN